MKRLFVFDFDIFLQRVVVVVAVAAATTVDISFIHSTYEKLWMDRFECRAYYANTII